MIPTSDPCNLALWKRGLRLRGHLAGSDQAPPRPVPGPGSGARMPLPEKQLQRPNEGNAQQLRKHSSVPRMAPERTSTPTQPAVLRTLSLEVSAGQKRRSGQPDQGRRVSQPPQAHERQTSLRRDSGSTGHRFPWEACYPNPRPDLRIRASQPNPCSSGCSWAPLFHGQPSMSATPSGS